MSSTTILWTSVAVGMVLFTLTILLGFINTQYGFNGNFLKWAILPTVGYLITIGFNAFIQSTRCKSINITQIAMGSLSVPIAIFGFLLLALIPFVRSPVEEAVPYGLRSKYAVLFAIAFYMFWAGMFGESIASGFAMSCPSQNQVGSPLPK